MLMTPGVRRFGLLVHIVSSVGLLGAIAVFLTLSVAGLLSTDMAILEGVYRSMDLAARWVVVPLALLSLASGFVQSLGTPWGLFRHYWVLAKFALTGFATAILLAKIELIGYAARLAADSTGNLALLGETGRELAVHAGGGLLVLLIPAVLSVYKPWGLTTRTRHAEAQRGDESMPPRRLPQPRTPRSLQPGAEPHARGGSITISVRRSVLVTIGVLALIVHVGLLHLIGAGHGGH